MTFRRIAIGIDLGADRQRPTPGSRRAVEQACALAEHWGARVTFVHSSAADEHWDAEDGWVFVAGDGPESSTALDQLIAELGEAGIEATVRIAHEGPELALSRRALRGLADLVVVGKRSVPGLDGRRLGSVALKCLRTCPCALWVVDPDASLTPRRVLAATDLSPVGERVLEAAGAVAGAFGAELHVVHALQVPLSVGFEDAEAAWAAKASRDAEACITRWLADTPVAGKASLHVVATSPTRAILEGAEQLEPDLVVLGSVARGGIAGLLVGNTAERVLPQLDASLLIVKPPDFVCPLESS